MGEMIPFSPGPAVAMSTREIAELTEKKHQHVLRDVLTMFEALALDPEGYVQNWTHPQNGQVYREYALPKDLTVTLIAGYSIQLRHRIVKRLEQLEAALTPAPFAIPQSFAEALRLAADNAERADKAEAQIAADAPKVAFAEQVEVAPDAISLGQCAKVFGTGRNRLCSKLREIGWLTRTNEPYQDKINSGYLDVKIGSWDHPEKGLQRSVTALVTGKGLMKLHRIIGGPSLPH